MIFKLFGICAVFQLVVSQQLPITFQDGRIGVNFGGYHAEAGLGGLLTGNAAHGGLSASAGTPFGQTAQAGLGGNAGPNARGGLFAGASAGNGVGASASLAGDANNGGSFGVGQAEAHAGGVQKEVIKTVSVNEATKVESNVDTSVEVDSQHNEVEVPDIPQTNPQSVIQNEYEHTNPTIVQTDQIEQSTQSIIQSTTTLIPETTVQSGSYLPPASASSVSTSSASIDEDDNDLIDNKVPQTPIQEQSHTIQAQAIDVPVTVVQKIKVRPRPAYTVVQKQVHVPATVIRTVPVQQIPIPVYQPAIFHKHIQIQAPYQVVQRVEEVQVTPGPTTTTTSTTPRPPYVYTYDKQKVINEIFSIPIHALRAVSEIINAKLSGGYSVQKTISYI